MDAKQTPTPLTLHQGLDYAVIMRPGENTDRAFVQVRYPDDDDMALLKKIVTAHNAHDDLVKAATRALNVIRAQGGESVRPGNVLGALEAALAKAKVTA